jgi:transcriptional regulator with XRE-family HTH domain
MNIGQAIELARARRKLSQDELAIRAGISVSYVSFLERSKRDPALSVVENIAKALNIPIVLLFFLGAEGKELGHLNKELAGELSRTVLDLLNEPVPIEALPTV